MGWRTGEEGMLVDESRACTFTATDIGAARVNRDGHDGDDDDDDGHDGDDGDDDDVDGDGEGHSDGGCGGGGGGGCSAAGLRIDTKRAQHPSKKERT